MDVGTVDNSVVYSLFGEGEMCHILSKSIGKRHIKVDGH